MTDHDPRKDTDTDPPPTAEAWAKVHHEIAERHTIELEEARQLLEQLSNEELIEGWKGMSKLLEEFLAADNESIDKKIAEKVVTFDKDGYAETYDIHGNEVKPNEMLIINLHSDLERLENAIWEMAEVDPDRGFAFYEHMFGNPDDYPEDFVEKFSIELTHLLRVDAERCAPVFYNVLTKNKPDVRNVALTLLERRSNSARTTIDELWQHPEIREIVKSHKFGDSPSHLKKLLRDHTVN